MDIEIASKENVAKRLKWLRDFYDLSQVDFSKNIGVLVSQYNNWERGRQRLSLEGALKINAVYGTTLDFLFLGRRELLSQEMLNDLASSDLEATSSSSSDKPIK
jgi:transcriptional regulator with XRE-family HTH domain